MTNAAAAHAAVQAIANDHKRREITVVCLQDLHSRLAAIGRRAARRRREGAHVPHPHADREPAGRAALARRSLAVVTDEPAARQPGVAHGGGAGLARRAAGTVRPPAGPGLRVLPGPARCRYPSEEGETHLVPHRPSRRRYAGTVRACGPATCCGYWVRSATASTCDALTAGPGRYGARGGWGGRGAVPAASSAAWPRRFRRLPTAGLSERRPVRSSSCSASATPSRRRRPARRRLPPRPLEEARGACPA